MRRITDLLSQLLDGPPIAPRRNPGGCVGNRMSRRRDHGRADGKIACVDPVQRIGGGVVDVFVVRVIRVQVERRNPCPARRATRVNPVLALHYE